MALSATWAPESLGTPSSSPAPLEGRASEALEECRQPGTARDARAHLNLKGFVASGSAPRAVMLFSFEGAPARQYAAGARSRRPPGGTYLENCIAAVGVLY